MAGAVMVAAAVVVAVGGAPAAVAIAAAVAAASATSSCNRTVRQTTDLSSFPCLACPETCLGILIRGAVQQPDKSNHACL